MFGWFGNEMGWLIHRFLIMPHNNHMHMITLLEKESSVPVKNVLRYWFCNRYPETGTNVTV